MKKNLLIIIVFFGILAAAISYQFYFKFDNDQFASNKLADYTIDQTKFDPLPEESILEITKNWKTYKNSKYGFEFKFPKDWIIVSEQQKEKYLDAFNDEIKEKAKKAGFLDLIIVTAPQNLALIQENLDWIDSLTEDDYKKGVSPSNAFQELLINFAVVVGDKSKNDSNNWVPFWDLFGRDVDIKNYEFETSDYKFQLWYYRSAYVDYFSFDKYWHCDAESVSKVDHMYKVISSTFKTSE